MSIERERVKSLHTAMDEALTAVGKVHGFEYKSAGLRFGDVEVSGRVSFILAGKVAVAMQEKTGHLAQGDLKIGDRVTIRNERSTDTYTIEKFTPGGGSHIKRERDGKKFRCRQAGLVKVKS